jgi:hypothetical protein
MEGDSQQLDPNDLSSLPQLVLLTSQALVP